MQMFAIMSGKKRQNWDNYKEKIAKKRGKNSHGEKNQSFNVEGGITVQRLSANVEGKCQKYTRIGPLTWVPMEDKEATLEGIKDACKIHFDTESECDVLAGERGPSLTSTSQIKNWKVIHVRFIEGAQNLVPAVKNRQSEPTKHSPKKRSIPTNTMSRSESTRSQMSVAPSISLSKMLKIGKVINPDADIITLHLEEFSIANMEWLMPFEVKLSLSRMPFAEGSFREAYLANVLSGLPSGKYVLKKYLKGKTEEITGLFGSLEAHTRKAVQLNALARNFAQNMALEVPSLEFGPTFRYNKVYYSILADEYVTLETFLEGTFEKFINNDGEICLQHGEQAPEIVSKAEAFVHYTYVRSKKQLMVTDIQGVSYQLCDPEIASSGLTDPKDNSVFFCIGNLSTEAIGNFLAKHSCNKYCNLLSLQGTDS